MSTTTPFSTSNLQEGLSSSPLGLGLYFSHYDKNSTITVQFLTVKSSPWVKNVDFPPVKYKQDEIQTGSGKHTQLCFSAWPQMPRKSICEAAGPGRLRWHRPGRPRAALPKMYPESCAHELGELGLHDQLSWGVPGTLICCW